jgi:hypothetical protein
MVYPVSDIEVPKMPNPVKPERIATKAPRHQEKIFIKIKLRVLVTWWRKYFVRKILRKRDVISINRA